MPPVLGLGDPEEVQAMRVECAAARSPRRQMTMDVRHRPRAPLDGDLRVAGQMVGLEAVERSTS